MKIEIKIDLGKLDDGEIQSLKMMAVKSQAFELAKVIRDYQKHCEAINKMNVPPSSNGI